MRIVCNINKVGLSALKADRDLRIHLYERKICLPVYLHDFLFTKIFQALSLYHNFFMKYGRNMCTI